MIGRSHRHTVGDDTSSLAATAQITGSSNASSSSITDGSNQNIVLDIVDGGVGAAQGFVQGFFGDGLKGNIEFAGSLLNWIYTTNLVGIIPNNYYSFFFGGPNGYQQAFDGYAAPVKAIKKTIDAARQYGPVAFRTASDMARLFSSDYLNALADGNQSNVAGLTANWYRTASLETRLVLDMVDPVVKTIVKELNSLTIKEKAHLIGRVNGLVTFEVLLSVATSGAGTAVKAGKVSEFLYDMSKFKFVTKYDNTGKITATLQKFADRLAVVLNTRVCFVAGTLVSTADGFKPIEELKVGDLVLTRNEFADGEETDNDYQPVTELITTHPGELLELTLSDGNSEETLTTTANHPFYSLDTRSFIHADQLEESSRVASADGQPLTVTAISRRMASEGENFTTYNIEVAGSHTYFVGRQRAWVHNTSTACKAAMKRFADVLDELDELGQPADKTKAVEEMLELLRSMEKSGDIQPGSVPQHFNDALRELANPDPPITPRLTADEVTKYSKLEPNSAARLIAEVGLVDEVTLKIPADKPSLELRIIPHRIANGKLRRPIVGGRLASFKGQLIDFVITMDGRLIVGRAHSVLSSGESVRFAGRMKFSSSGYLKVVDNWSGHYETPAIAEKALKFLEKKGVNTSNAIAKNYDLSGL